MEKWAIGVLALLVGLPAPASTAEDEQAGESLPAVRARPWEPDVIEPVPSTTYQSPQPTIEIGMHYAFVERRRRMRKVAELLAETGVQTVKVFPDQVTWGEMQSSASHRINFSRLDRFVRTYQEAGFRHLILTLKSHSPWASRACGRGGCANPTPRPEYQDLYRTWVAAVVERYDGDGRDDMKHLRFPVRWFEVGARFSHDEPEPAEQYVEMLRLAYEAAHAAAPEARVIPAGLHTTTVFAEGRRPADLEAAFEAARRVIHHDLASVRTLLDAHDAYDAVNIHSLGDPYEIEGMIPWLREELEARGVEKPIVITDSAPSPFVAWGPATTCRLQPSEMGVIIPPATEADRCRLAAYFRRLTENEGYTTAWVHRQVAADLIKKVVLAAEQGVALISTGYMQDIEGMTRKRAEARIGNAAWAGMIDLSEKERRPIFFALERLNHHLRGYDSVERISTPDDRIRVYRFERARGPIWIAWAEPDGLTLPGDPLVRLEIDVPTKASNVIVERMIDRAGMVNPSQRLARRSGGYVTFTVSQHPTFVLTGF